MTQTQEPNIIADPPSETAEQQQIPDGIGLPLEAVRTLLAKQHNTRVGIDDPILMVGTMINAYLGEVEKQNMRLQEGMAKLLAAKTDGYVKGVHAATDALAQNLSTASVEAIRKVFLDNAQQLVSFRNAIWYAASVVAVSALVNVTAFALLALR